MKKNATLARSAPVNAAAPAVKKNLKIWLDGKLIDRDQAKISVYDHGLLYGDGVFEGIRLYNGKVFKHKEHIDRLYLSARAIGMEIPMGKGDMMQAVEETCRVNGHVNAYIRLVVTRGEGTLGIDPRKCPRPTVFIIADTITLYPAEMYEKGMTVVTAATPRNAPEAINPRVKSLNYLNNIMAKIEANTYGVGEVVMLNHQGVVCEGSADNLFIVKNRVLKTPQVTDGILEGITRNTVIDIARGIGYTVLETSLQRYDLYTADEFFMTGTGAELIPVVTYDGRSIGAGKPGPVFKQLREKYIELTQRGA